MIWLVIRKADPERPIGKPVYPDHCKHLQEGGKFLGTTAGTSGRLHDVYMFQERHLPHRSLCIRYGKEPHEYASGHRSPEEFSDPKRMIGYQGQVVRASVFDGPEMELVRAHLEREKKP